MTLQAGTAVASLSPFWGVELAGWGYYLERTWQRVRDPLAASALVLEDGNQSFGLVAVDLMYADADFVHDVRQQVAEHTNLAPTSICVGCSHSHNSPTVALIRGAGEVHPDYRVWAARQTASALIAAWHNRQEASFAVGQCEVDGLTYNRTRENGPVDTRLSVWKLTSTATKKPLAAVVNFQAHPTVMMALGAYEVARDYPGQIVDRFSDQYPGIVTLYFQGACGDVNFDPRFQSVEECEKPGQQVADLAVKAFKDAESQSSPIVASSIRQVTLPTRRWTQEEIQRDREEGLYRVESGDTTNWRENLGRVMVNKPDLFPSRYGGDLQKAVLALGRFGVEWTTQALEDLESRPETLTTEVQAMRVGDAWLVSNPSEFFTSLALDVRRQWKGDDLMIVGYANDSIGYLPDPHDIERSTYAANQSPKFKNQFPFVAESGTVMVQGMLDTLDACCD